MCWEQGVHKQSERQEVIEDELDRQTVKDQAKEDMLLKGAG